MDYSEIMCGPQSTHHLTNQGKCIHFGETPDAFYAPGERFAPDELHRQTEHIAVPGVIVVA
jgi:hypothetical protein